MGKMGCADTAIGLPSNSTRAPFRASSKLCQTPGRSTPRAAAVKIRSTTKSPGPGESAYLPWTEAKVPSSRVRCSPTSTKRSSVSPDMGKRRNAYTSWAPDFFASGRR